MYMRVDSNIALSFLAKISTRAMDSLCDYSRKFIRFVSICTIKKMHSIVTKSLQNVLYYSRFFILVLLDARVELDVLQTDPFLRHYRNDVVPTDNFLTLSPHIVYS